MVVGVTLEASCARAHPILILCAVQLRPIAPHIAADLRIVQQITAGLRRLRVSGRHGHPVQLVGVHRCQQVVGQRELVVLVLEAARAVVAETARIGWRHRIAAIAPEQGAPMLHQAFVGRVAGVLLVVRQISDRLAALVAQAVAEGKLAEISNSEVRPCLGCKTRGGVAAAEFIGAHLARQRQAVVTVAPLGF